MGSRGRAARLLALALSLAGCAAPGADAPPPHLAAATSAPADTARWSDALQGTVCTETGDSVFAPEAVELHALEPGVELVQVRCEMAAYQGIYAYLLRDTRGQVPRVTPLRLPWMRLSDDGTAQPAEVAELVGSPRFDADRRELSVVTRYRGVGDCGEAGVVRFVGTEPELASFRAKPECDGTVVDAAEWPRVDGDGPAAPSAAPRTPPPGSAERSAILDALRADMGRMHGRTLRFTVRHLAVTGGWAWVEADPSGDDGSRFETVSVLMHNEGGWRVLEYVPGFGEREGTPLEDDCRWFEDLLRRRPAVPPAILPPETRPPCGALRGASA